MAAIITTAEIVLTLFVYLINGDNLISTVVFSPSELIQDNSGNNTFKFALRYGFQRTSECKDFSKAFICVQKCLDLGFDVAHSNRHCFCTCYHKRGKPKSTTSKTVTKTKWKLGAPTTKLPPWAASPKTDLLLIQNETADVQYVLQDGNMTDIVFNVQTENATIGTDTLATGAIANSTDIPGTVNTGIVTNDALPASVKEDNSTQIDGAGTPKDAEKVTGTDAEKVTGTGADKVTGTGDEKITGTGVEKVTGTGQAAEGAQKLSASDNTGGTENSQSGTATQPVGLKTDQSDSITGGTEKPKEAAGVTTVST